MSISTTSSANDTIYEPGTLENTVQDVEGNTYRTVKIGDQIWLAENLRSTKFQDGSEIRTAFIPKDDEKNLMKYGRLYDWADVTDERNLCPVGWRVATDDDWKALEKSIGMAETDLDKKGWRGDGKLAHMLKEAQVSSLFSRVDQSLVNQTHFAATAAGVKWGRFYITQGLYSEFWTSTEASEKEAVNRTLAYSRWNKNKGNVYRSSLSKNYSFSVRCVKI